MIQPFILYQLGTLPTIPVYNLSKGEGFTEQKKLNMPKYVETFRMSHLLRKLLLTQLVEREKLPGQNNVVNEATTSQLHPYDNLTVRDHHGYRAEVNLQVFREFLPPSITRILYRK